jgi:hypothetical protein
MGREGIFGNPDSRTVGISTGHTVDLPVKLEASMLGATFAVPTASVAEFLPDRLTPLTVTPTGKAAITLLSVHYRSVDIDGMEPYNEFAVIIPAAHEQSTTVPYLSALMNATNGYVWFMPVTTEPARAFGVDIWGFPKVIGDITHRETGSGRETTVSIDGEQFITFEAEYPPSIQRRDDGSAYTVKDDRLLRVPSEVDAAVGLWPMSSEISVSFGEHPKAKPFRSLDLGPRALARLSLDGAVYFHEGNAV